MSSHVVLADLAALLLALAGFHLAFRQRLVRRWWDLSRARRGRPPLSGRSEGEDEDPAHYALIIFGTMIMAFGLILFAFTTSFASLT